MLLIKRRYIFIFISLLFLIIGVVYFTRNIYYINEESMFVKIENKDDMCIVYFSKTINFEKDYVKYKPASAEISDLHIYCINDTLYVKEQYLNILQIESSNYIIIPVICKYGDKIRGEKDEWSDSTIFKKKCLSFTVNHRHGIYIYKK